MSTGTTAEFAGIATPQLPWDAVDPYPFYEARRRVGDVVWDETAQAWLVLGHEAAREVLGGTGWTSDPLANPASRAAMDPINAEFSRRSMLFADGATHRRLRGAVRDVFTRSFIDGLATGVEAIAAAIIGAPPAGTAFDFMSEIALPIPIAVIGEWLGLGTESLRLLRETAPAVIAMLGTLADTADLRAGSAAAAALTTEFLPLAADRRTHPGDDLISFIAADPALELDDIVATSVLLAVAGHETTANFLGASLIRLLSPGSDGARPADRVEVTDPVVTELLRLDAPAQAAARIATENHRVGGMDIAAGDPVLVVIAAANRDPAVYPDPGQFRPGRIWLAPLSFGHGAHYCLGSALARLEITVALRRILARRPVLAGPVCWRETPAIRGPLSVPTVFGSD